jgi:hypothetical protein
MKIIISIAVLFCVYSGNLFASDDVSAVIDIYNNRERTLLSEVETGLTNSSVDITSAILELGTIRSSKATPLLATNLLYRYANNPWGIVMGGVSKATPIYGPAPRALGNIKPSLQTLLSMLHSDAQPSETKNSVVFSLCVGLYKECFINEILFGEIDYNPVFVRRVAAVKQEKVFPNLMSTPKIKWYETAVDDLIVKYWSSRSDNDIPRLSCVLFVLGHLRALKAKPIILEFLRNSTEVVNPEITSLHEEALKDIGLPLPELLRELIHAEAGSEWQAFLIKYGKETEGDVFIRAYKKMTNQNGNVL